MQKDWDYVKTAAETKADGSLAPLEKNAGFSHDEELLRVIEAAAFKYLIDGEQETGRKAVNMIKNYMATAVFDESSKDYWQSNAAGAVMSVAAEIYDWCYYILSEAEKKDMIKEIKRLARCQEHGYPPEHVTDFNGHVVEQQIFRDILSAGIAVYDEDPEFYDIAAAHILDQLIPARNFAFRAGMHYQGDSYGLVRHTWEALCLMIFSRMGYDGLFSPDIGKLAYSWIYFTRPDGQMMRDGDTFMAARAIRPAQWYHGAYWSHPAAYLYCASYFGDEITKGFFNAQYNKYKTGAPGLSPVMYLLYNDPDLKGASHKNMPHARYFGAPQGILLSRTGWTDGYGSNTAMAWLEIGETYFSNHAHLDSGQFQLYYKGALAIDSGIYGRYGDAHDMYYYKRSVAHNCISVMDPDEIFISWGEPRLNDGGQRLPFDGKFLMTMDNMMLDGFDTGKVEGTAFGPCGKSPEFSYISGDLSRAYSKKVEKYKRSFVFLDLKNDGHPAALIVYDRLLNAKDGLQTSWLLHTIEEPDICAETSSVTVRRTEGGYNGKMVLDSFDMNCGALEIRKLGGEGFEFPVRNINIPPYMNGNMPESDDGTPLHCQEPGAWRIEISTEGHPAEQRYLNVMQVMDNNGGPEPLPVLKIASDKFCGVIISDRLVAFPNGYGDISVEFKLEIPGASGSEPVKTLICGLSPGTWLIKSAKNKNICDICAEVSVKEGEGILYASLKPEPGGYLISPAT
jgi:hypothetical protein